MLSGTCPFCGAEFGPNDKYCKSCGKPLLKPIKPVPPSPSDSDKNDDGSFPTLADILLTEKQQEGDNADKNSVPFMPSAPENKDIHDESPSEAAVKEGLPEDVKEQLDLRIKLALLNVRKNKLVEMLEKLEKELSSDKITDPEYIRKIKFKLEAVKELKEEYSHEEDEIKKKLKKLRFEELDEIIAKKKEQLSELKMQLKFKKIDRNIFEEVKEEYRRQYEAAKSERAALERALLVWISRLKSEQNRIEKELKLLKARYSTKEIDAERYNEMKEELLKKINNIKVSINTLYRYIREK